jgi:Tfp pilus assembly protein PilX
MEQHKQINKKQNTQAGNILFTSLLLMLAMNFMGIALVQTAQREYQTADFKTIDSSNFYLAESCANDAIDWVKSQSRPPTTLPYTITKSDLSHLYTVTESTDNRAKLSGYSYNCSVSQVAVVSTTGTEVGNGEDVSASTGYGASGDLRPDYFYQITSNASGPKNSSKTITTLIAVEY